MAAYNIEARPRARRALRQIAGTRKDVLEAMRAFWHRSETPRVKPLKGHRPWLRVRVGDYRIIYDVDDAARLVTVAVAGHRREVYRGLDR